MIRRFLTGWLLVCASAFSLSAQPLFAEEEMQFLFAVKQVDEFIERFNNQESTLLRQHMKEINPELDASRSDMIKGLFDLSDRQWNMDHVRRFVAEVSDSAAPTTLSFYDNEWYAEATCSVLYQGKPQKARLVLRVERQPRRGSKWVLTGASAPFLLWPEGEDPSKALNPYSHGTDFMNLDLALADTRNVRNYLPADYRADVLTLFLNAMHDGRLEFKQVDTIRYHFLQVDGWIFTLQNFNRSSRNSGWLINQLIPSDEVAKQKYKTYRLGIN